MNTPARIYELGKYRLSRPIDLVRTVIPAEAGFYGKDLFTVVAKTPLGLTLTGEGFVDGYSAIKDLGDKIESQYDFLLAVKKTGPLKGAARTFFEKISRYIYKPRKK